MNLGTKRYNRTFNYQRPEKTYQESLTNQEIKEKLKDYKKVEDITKVLPGTHIRYFSTDKRTKKKTFKLGGSLMRIDPEGRFVILGSELTTWSVQIPDAIFYVKMSENELKEELKKELKREIISQTEMSNNDTELQELKKENKILKKKIEQYKDLETEYKDMAEKYKDVLSRLNRVEKEITKEKSKKEKHK